MELKRTLELAGVVNSETSLEQPSPLKNVDSIATNTTIQLNEMVSGDKLQEIVQTIFKMVEEEAFTRGAESRAGVSRNQILEIAQAIIKTLEDGVSDLIQQDVQNK